MTVLFCMLAIAIAALLASPTAATILEERIGRAAGQASAAGQEALARSFKAERAANQIVFDDSDDNNEGPTGGINNDAVQRDNTVGDSGFGNYGDEMWHQTPAPPLPQAAAPKPEVFSGDVNRLLPGAQQMMRIPYPIASMGPEYQTTSLGNTVQTAAQMRGWSPESNLRDRAPAGSYNHYLEVMQTAAKQTASASGSSAAADTQQDHSGDFAGIAGGKQAHIIKEYDDQAAEGDATTYELHHDEASVKDGESVTLEDQRRLLKGDVEHVQPHPPQHHVSPRLRKQAHHVTPPQHKKRAALVAHTSKHHMMTRSAASRMKQQCTSYASYLSGKMISGPELIRVWKGTCSPAVQSGDATEAFNVMCNVLGSAVEEFATKPTWDAAAVCDAVLKTFNEAQIGV